MRCPYCRENCDKVIDSRSADDGRMIRRRRQCQKCNKRFTTHEQIEMNHRLWVIKKDGTRVPYDHQKLLAGLQKACYKRPINIEAILKLAEDVEDHLFKTNDREVNAAEIGRVLAERLKHLDHVAYVRFASVYKQFRDLDDLLEEVRDILKPDQTNSSDQGQLF